MTRNRFKLHDLPWVDRLRMILLTLIIGVLTPLPGSQNIAEAIPTPKKSPERWIQVDLSQQKLTAWEGKRRVYTVKISSGKKSTPTPVGRFRIQSKHRTTRMRVGDMILPMCPILYIIMVVMLFTEHTGINVSVHR